jgi:hypothetical protein
MSDIVERLREIIAEGEIGDLGLSEAPETALEAIAEIERLRATIAQLRAVAGAVSVEGHSYADIRKDIRNAPTG